MEKEKSENRIIVDAKEDYPGILSMLEILSHKLVKDYSANNKKSPIDILKEEFSELIELLYVSSKEFDSNSFIGKLKKYLEENQRLLYSEFTIKIINFSKDDNNGNILTNIETNLSSCIEHIYNNEEEKVIFSALLKLWDHYNLACTQFNMFTVSDDVYLGKINPIINPKIEELKKEYSTLEKEVSNSKKETKNLVKEINDTKKSIITEIISLISIFVAISFVMFGGMTMLNNLFDFKDMDTVPVKELLCLGSLFGIIIIGVCYLFITFILYIIGKLPITRNSDESGSVEIKGSCFFSIYVIAVIVLVVVLVVTFLSI